MCFIKENISNYQSKNLQVTFGTETLNYRYHIFILVYFEVFSVHVLRPCKQNMMVEFHT